jgi:hypothetical protein
VNEQEGNRHDERNDDCRLQCACEQIAAHPLVSYP